MKMPTVEVKLTGWEQLVTLQTSNNTQCMWDIERAKQGWPQPGDGFTLWATWIAWAECRRQGHVDKSMPFAAFSEQVEQLDLVTETTADVDPTPSDPAPG